MPWLLIGIYAALVILVATMVRTREPKVASERIAGADDVAPSRRPSTAPRVAARLLWAATLLPLVGVALVRDWDPLWAGDAIAPGPDVAEVRADGTWQSDSIEHASSFSWTAGEPCLTECPGPRWIFRVGPGETYSYVLTIWNHGSIPITLLGRPMLAGAPASGGLALLRDPQRVSADPSNLVPFHPVNIQAGEMLSVAWLGVAPACADPTALVKPLTPGGGWSTGHPFIYEVLGWRRDGIIWSHFSTTLAGCDEPDPAPPIT